MILRRSSGWMVAAFAGVMISYEGDRGERSWRAVGLRWHNVGAQVTGCAAEDNARSRARKGRSVFTDPRLDAAKERRAAQEAELRELGSKARHRLFLRAERLRAGELTEADFAQHRVVLQRELMQHVQAIAFDEENEALVVAGGEQVDRVQGERIVMNRHDNILAFG